jgi:ABC-type spermidine/putrescine transport system permease subunit I
MKRSPAVWLAPAAILWGIGVLAPLVWLVRLSLYWQGNETGEHRFDVLFYHPGTLTLDNYYRIFTDRFYLRMILFTAGLGLLVTAVTAPLGYVLGYAIYRSTPRAKALLVLLIALPKFTNILVFVYGLKILLGPNGLGPVVAGEVLLLLPYAALTIAAALEAVPFELVEAARGLGASAFAAFWNVTFRLSLPGVITAGLLTLVWSLGAFLGPYLLGGPEQYTIAVQVERETNLDLRWALAAALNMVLLAIVAALGYAVSRFRMRLP